MKIITNEKNPALLKLLLAARLSHSDVLVENVSLNVADKKATSYRSIPVLELDSGLQLFSVNQAARFLFPPVLSIETEVDQWIEWDVCELQSSPVPIVGKLNLCSGLSAPDQPTLLSCVLSPGKHNDHFLSLLTALNKCLAGQDSLVKGGLTVADVCVWSTLFSVASDPKLRSEWISKFKNIEQWWSRLQTNLAFEHCVKVSAVVGGISGLQSLSSCSLYSGVTPPCSTVKALDKAQQRDKQPSSSATLENGMNKLEISSGPAMEGPEWDELMRAARTSWEGGLNDKLKPNIKPVLPVPGERNVLVTSALPYVNNVPHLGNIIGCVLSADVFARYCRLMNYNTLYISGTDEYGTATETKALEEGLEPKEICDKYNAVHNDIYSWFNIEFDLFGRTTIPEQTEITQDLFLRLHKLGYMFTEAMEQLLCQKCDRYLADRFVEGICPKCSYVDARGDQCDGCGTLINTTDLIKPRCKLCGDTPVIRNSDQFFLDLPKIEPKLKEWFETRSSGWTHNARVITKAWLKDGLRPRCITRDLKWGIPVPLADYQKKVFYVWFDAPIGYMSMTKKYTEKWREWWQPKGNTEVDYFQFMAKDNVPFHSIMFPATLLAADQGYTTVSHIMATEYLNYEDGKFSKSRGLGVFGNDARDTGIPADYWRFYLLFVRPESQDSSFCWDDLALRINTELLNNLGNFVNRALMFVEKTFNSSIPEICLEQDDIIFLTLVNREINAYIQSLELAKLRDGLRHILSISRHGNQYIQFQQPWVKAKGSVEEKKRAGTVVGVAANIACLISVLLHPYMPHISRIMQEQMNSSPENMIITLNAVQLFKPGHKIGKPSPLFMKIEASQVSELKSRFAGKQSSPAPAEKPKNATDGPKISCDNISQLTAAVEKQAKLVREMKESGKTKSEWQPHVNVLLQMKADLAAALKNAPAAALPSNSGNTKGPVQAEQTDSPQTSCDNVSQLTAAVENQAKLVREMKESGKTKSEWQPHVNVLLQMKADLAAALKNAPAAALPSNSGNTKGPAQSEQTALQTPSTAAPSQEGKTDQPPNSKKNKSKKKK